MAKVPPREPAIIGMRRSGIYFLLSLLLPTLGFAWGGMGRSAASAGWFAIVCRACILRPKRIQLRE
jgi:hypothetical protein